MFALKGSSHPFSIDTAHAVLLAGVIMSHKPSRVLEIGIGPGCATEAILAALDWNGCGELVAVDNFIDTGGSEPPLVGELKKRGVTVVVSSEAAFCKSCESQYCDVLVSDADHQHAQDFVTDHLRMVRPGGWLFYHDTANPSYPNLAGIVKSVAHLRHTHFARSSRPDENCGRGWLMVRQQG